MAATPTPLKLSALHHKHLELKAELLKVDGWMVPDHYPKGPEDEVKAAMTSLAISDRSQLGKLEIKGPGTDSLLQSISSSPGVPGAPGEVLLGPVLSDPALGAAFSPLYLCKLARDQALLVYSGTLPPGPNPMDVALSGRPVERAYATNVTSVYAGINLSGPNAFEILSRLTQVDVSPRSFPSGRCLQAGFANILALLVHVDGRYEGQAVPSYDLFFGREYAEYVWDSIMEAGDDEVGVFPMGISAYNRLHPDAAKTAGRTAGVNR
ncbi:MAG: hypothetical protein OK456_04725 [Thaumarchaeota archaeon]|nr:hypothetical protein [Nitrososphaerota archaeon]